MSFRHALSVRAWLGAAWCAAGDAARSARVLDEGRALLRRIADIDPQSIEYRRVAAVTTLRHDQAAAVADLERLVDAALSAKILPRHVDLLHDLGRAYAARGESTRAREAFRRALTRATDADVDPTHLSVLAVRVALAGLQIDGAPEHAASLLKPVLSDQPLAHGLTALATAHPLRVAARSLLDRIGKRSERQ
jgi:tetratricopeptide (TPR) repeat protein